MNDPKRKLTHREVAQAGLDGWRQLVGSIRVRYRTGDFATGLRLVEWIGAAAEAANHHPELRLSYREVLVELSSHDVGGITSRDLDLARLISGYAAELGVVADAAGLTRLDLGLDTISGAALAPFYAALLGSRLKEGEPIDPSGQVPSVWWQEPDDRGPALPDSDVPQRWHLDVWVPLDEGERRVQAALAAGGTLVSDERAPAYWVIADPDGNRSCVCTVAQRD